MILQFAHFIRDKMRAEGHKDIAVRAQALVSLNGRRPRPLVGLETDLAKEERNLKHADWILPLKEPLPKKWDSEQQRIARTFKFG